MLTIRELFYSVCETYQIGLKSYGTCHQRINGFIHVRDRGARI